MTAVTDTSMDTSALSEQDAAYAASLASLLTLDHGPRLVVSMLSLHAHLHPEEES